VEALTDSNESATITQNPRLAKHIGRVHKALQTLKNHKTFADLESLEPLKISEGGTLGPFCQKDCTAVLKSQNDLPTDRRTGYGPVAINCMWINHTWLVNHRVDRIDAQLESIKKTHYPYNAPPASATHVCHIAVPGEKYSVHDHIGSLQRVSPEELTEVILFSVVDAINNKSPDDILDAWKTLMLTIPAVFERHDDAAAMFWRGQNLREKLVDTGYSLQRSIRQRIYDVSGFKKELEKDGSAEVGSLLS
jgi:hypothetical protein